ncbi:MAG: DJ-1 family glyoxalase III [Acutalibacter sp.]
MKQAAVLMARGFEEGETVTIVDILRRAGIRCVTFYFDEEFVTGMHGMRVKADQPFGPEVQEFDVVILPGGRPGGANLLSNPDVLEMVRFFNGEGKYVAAMCSGTLVLEEAGVIEGKRVTGYTGYETRLTGGIFVPEVVVADQNIITSQGPATPYPFAYKIAELLGADVEPLKEKMLYHFAKGK